MLVVCIQIGFDVTGCACIAAIWLRVASFDFRLENSESRKPWKARSTRNPRRQGSESFICHTRFWWVMFIHPVSNSDTIPPKNGNNISLLFSIWRLMGTVFVCFSVPRRPTCASYWSWRCLGESKDRGVVSRPGCFSGYMSACWYYICSGVGIIQIDPNNSKYRSQLPFDTERDLYHHCMSMEFQTTINSVAGFQFERAQDFAPTSCESGLNNPVFRKPKKKHGFFVDFARANLVVCVHPLRPPT